MVDGAPIVTIAHPPGENGTPGATDTYEARQTNELLHDVATHAIERIEARSAWRTWTNEPQAAEDLRIALRGPGLDGYYLYTPLDSAGIPYATAAALRFSDVEPEAEANIEVPLNLHAAETLQQIYRAIRTPA